MKNKIETMKFGSCIAKNQLVLYLQNNLDRNSSDLIDSHIKSCEYCAEAIEGLKQLPDINSLNALPLLWKNRTGISTPSMKYPHYSKLIYVALSVAVVVVAIFIYQGNDSKSIQEISKQEIKNSYYMPDEVNENKSVETLTQAGSKNSSMNQTDSREVEPDRAIKIAERIQPIEIYTFNKTSVEYCIALHHKNSNEKIIYLENLKTIDYSEKYKNKTNQLQQAIGGVSALYDNRDQQRKAENISSEESYNLSYEKALSNGLRDMNNGNFNEAIEDFNLILRYFPSDMNCKFYKSLAYENIFNYENAEPFLQELSSSVTNAFYEEAKWHLALVKLSSEKRHEAKDLLNEIVSEQGFYKAQAEEKLEILN